MSRFGRNTISNVVSKLWSLVSVYVFIPFYISILGETSYGLISFFATLQTALQLLGLGLTNTLRREFAVADTGPESKREKYLLLRSVENIYFLLGIVIIMLCTFGSTFIANQWLNIEDLNPLIVSRVISLMGGSIALQMIASLYSGCLFGMDYQVLGNTCTIVWSFAKSAGALAIISFISPNLVLFYSWHIATDIVYLVTLRLLINRKLDIKPLPIWKIKNASNLQRIWKYAFGILFISLIALVNKQLDKVIISKYLTLTELGAYNVATTLGGAAGIIPSALYTSVFPKFTKDATGGNKERLVHNFKVVNKVVNIFLCCMGSFLAVYALPLIEVWTGSSNYVSILGVVGMLVVLAVTTIEFQQIPFALALAHGNTKINVFVGGVFIPIVAISTFVSIKLFGLVGAGAIYLIMMLMQTLLYEYMVLKKYITEKPIRLIIADTILPMIAALIVAYLSKLFINIVTDSAILTSIFAVCVGGLTALLMYFIYGKIELKEFIHMRED